LRCQTPGPVPLWPDALRGLIDALQCDFDTIGDADQLDIQILEGGEFVTTHRRFGFEFHTHMNTRAYIQEQVALKVTRHFRYLARMPMQDRFAR